jgi:hypothetical protein
LATPRSTLPVWNKLGDIPHLLVGSGAIASSLAFCISLEASSLAFRSVIRESSRALLASVASSASIIRNFVLTDLCLTKVARAVDFLPILSARRRREKSGASRPRCTTFAGVRTISDRVPSAATRTRAKLAPRVSNFRMSHILTVTVAPSIGSDIIGSVLLQKPAQPHFPIAQSSWLHAETPNNHKTECHKADEVVWMLGCETFGRSRDHLKRAPPLLRDHASLVGVRRG